MKRNRFFAFGLATLLVMAVCFNVVNAYSGTDSINASTTLSSYGVVLTVGTDTGEIDISYDICAKRIADSVGISTLKIYKSNGTLVATITGTTSNGLIVENSNICFDTYTYTGTAGTSYYAIATVFAEIGSSYDSVPVMTNTVTAPSSTTP